ncbi:hypothetical protein HMPREF1441_00133 [Helicobacter pylori HP250ASi]|uniref:hypothetical protein n=1 Tax=Helicobacter pylori TaxID=210 RepID=UPI0002B9D5A5|nr:hypothetical protein [Helicobacter pylori]EMH51015.1 hypothetical protein HMPREF1442_01582 [Helicobacter pylori HP250ASii]EMH54824.1 hypothetical protein HMPREF1441_00133 [Helicobacter pylori HP250ASi]EMH64494.1 hypothetical protein HMPREF1447_00088 [Helicobacter pylori HP250BSi]WRE88575.1 hypothetical protein KVE45_00565 [Helicobacter pylori]
MLREFVASIDAKAQEEKQTGKTPTIPKYASCQNGLNEFLVPWGYACKTSPGTGLLSHEPSIAFCRQDILGEGFVNGEKPTPKKGFYLWLAYCWRKKDAKKFYLRIGRSTEQDEEKELQKCQAYDKIVKPNGGAYYRESYDDLEADLENITNDFLRFANEFNQIPTAYFKLEPSSASH